MNNTIKELYVTACSVRNELLEKYGHDSDLTGKCIEASDTLCEKLAQKGYACESIQCWCLYEDWENCPEICYEEHWVTEVKMKDKSIFIDATYSQFRWAFYNELPDIYISDKLPDYFLREEPDKLFLQEIGWEDYYENGDVNCDFEFKDYNFSLAQNIKEKEL